MAQQEQCAPSEAWAKIKSRLRAELGEDVFASWFRGVELDQVDEEVVHLTVATRFLRNWLRTHYYDSVLRLARAEWPAAERVEFRVRQPHFGNDGASEQQRQKRVATPVPAAAPELAPLPMPLRTGYGGFEGSPLDPRLSFTSFVHGASNRLAYAAAQEVASAFSTPQALFNPLFLHGNVGLGKTHLLHAISWDVKQRKPEAEVLYLTAERFMSGFVQALRARDALAFKEKLRKIDILLIDDMEFLQGPTIQQEFCHTLNSLIDGGRQVVVAADRAPTQLDKLDMRMRSRLGGGLVAEIGAMEYELRHKILQKRAQEACAETRGLNVSDTVLAFLAERLTESGRELEGAVHRLRASYQLTDEPVTIENAEQIVRDLMRGAEPQTRAHRRHLAHGVQALRGEPRRPPVGAAQPLDRAPAPDRHVSRQAAHVALAAGDRPQIRQSRPHHRAARDPQDRAADERRHSAPRGDRASEALAARLEGRRRGGLGLIPRRPPPVLGGPEIGV